MDYNKLKTFVIVAETGSVTAAGDVLRRTQSAVSQQIQLLEDELELKLFERRSGKIFLSADGQKIYEIAKARLNAIDDDLVALKKSNAEAAGHIRLGALVDGTLAFDVGSVVGGFAQKYPNVTFSIVGGTEAELEQCLISNELDLAMKIVFQQPEMFVQVPVASAPFALYTSPAYLKQRGAITNFKQVVEAELIDLSSDFISFLPFARKNAPGSLAALQHRQPNVVVASLEIARQIVLSGYGICILPEHLAAADLKSGKLVKVLPNAKPTSGGVDLAYRTNRTLRLCEKLFIDFAKR